MGHLTEEMTRLCHEIVALRGARQGFVKDLTQHVVAMKANFHRSRADMARKTRAERRAFMSHLKKSVAGLRHEFVTDLQGARRAWMGK